VRRREVEAQVVAVRSVAAKPVLDQPVLAGDEGHGPLVHRLVARAPRLADEDVELRRAQAAEEAPLGDGSTGLAAPVGGLVEPVDADGVVGGGSLEPAPEVGRVLGIGVSARIDDERTAGAVRLEAQQVVVPVAPVAERPAVEHQEAIALALQVVAPVRKGDVAPRRRLVVPTEEPAGEREQLAVAARVAVGERGDPAVRAMDVAGEVARPCEPLVVAAAEVEPVPRGVLARRDERPERDEVVVRRRLPVDAVGVKGVAKVAAQRVDGEGEQSVLVELGERERQQKERVELEGAVVPLGRQRGANVPRLRSEAGELSLRERRPELAERVPRVEPVLDPARGDLARVVIGRDLLEPRADEPLPGVPVRNVAGLATRVREVEAVVELDPLDPPLLVLGERRSEPVGLDAERAGDAAVGEAAGEHGLGDGAVAVQVLDRAEERPRGEERPWGCDRAHASASRKRAAIRSASRAPSKRSRTVASPAAASRARSPASRCTRSSASTSASGSSGSTSSPLTPSSTISGMPEIRVVTTGRPAAIASTITLGIPSRS